VAVRLLCSTVYYYPTRPYTRALASLDGACGGTLALHLALPVPPALAVLIGIRVKFRHSKKQPLSLSSPADRAPPRAHTYTGTRARTRGHARLISRGGVIPKIRGKIQCEPIHRG